MVPDPIDGHRKLELTIYQLAHGVTFILESQCPWLSMFSTKSFAYVQIHVQMLLRVDEWKKEAIGFIENSHFPCNSSM